MAMCRDPESTGNMWPGEIEGNLIDDIVLVPCGPRKGDSINGSREGGISSTRHQTESSEEAS